MIRRRQSQHAAGTASAAEARGPSGQDLARRIAALERLVRRTARVLRLTGHAIALCDRRGRPRIIAGASDDDADAGLSLLDLAGVPRLHLAVDPEPHVEIMSADGHTVMADLSATPMGAGLVVYDRTGKPRASLYTSEIGEPALDFLNAHGEPCIRISIPVGGDPRICIEQATGSAQCHRILLSTNTVHGPAIVIGTGPDGETAILGADRNRHAYLSVGGDDDAPEAMLPDALGDLRHALTGIAARISVLAHRVDRLEKPTPAP